MAQSDTTRDDPPSALRPGATFGDYRIVRCIGVGGMGSVFEAVHLLLDRRVALKVLHTSMPTTAELDPRARFVREGAMLVRVQHPNVVSVYDAGSIDDQPYIAMELLEGATFDRISASQGRMSPRRAVDLVADAAEGLEAAHRQGIVHRDVKPENLFVARGPRGTETAKIVDFGIAKEFRTSGARNTAIGTPAYMSPEQLLGGHPVDGRCDQYSLAVVLYEALTGSRPYEAPSLVELAIKLERGEAEPPSARGAPISIALDSVVMRGLAVDPTRRFPSMSAFADALRSATTGGLADDPESHRATAPSEPPVAFEPTRPLRRSSFPHAGRDEEPVAAASSVAGVALPIGAERGARPRDRVALGLGVAVFLALVVALSLVLLRPDPRAASPRGPATPPSAVSGGGTASGTVPATPGAALESDRPRTPPPAPTTPPPTTPSTQRPTGPRTRPIEPTGPVAPAAPSGLILER